MAISFISNGNYYGRLNIIDCEMPLPDGFVGKVIDPYDDSLVINGSVGCYFEFKCDSNHMYEQVKKEASKIGDKLYKFYFGEYPQGKLSKEEDKKLLKLYEDGLFNMTGRVYYYYFSNGTGCNFFEVEYEGRKYIKLDEKFIEVLPVEWIIDDELKRIISYRILAKPRDDSYGLMRMDTEITQKLYNGKSEEFNLFNGVLEIKNGELVKYEGLYGSHYFSYGYQKHELDEFYVPYGVTSIENVDFSKVQKLRIASSVDSFKGRPINIELQYLELYDNINFYWHNKFVITDFVSIHYSNYGNLQKFLIRFGNYVLLKKSTKFHFYGPKLTIKQKNEIRKVVKHRCTFTEDIDYKEKYNDITIQEEKSDDSKNSMSDVQRRLLELREEIINYFKYYSDSDKMKEDFEEYFTNYESALMAIDEMFNTSDKSITEKRALVEEIKELYNEFVRMLINKTTELELNLEYFKMIDYINSCISILKFEIKDSDKPFLKRLIEYAKKICVLGKSEQEEVLDSLISKLVEQRSKIQERIDDPDNSDFRYTNAASFESYFEEYVSDDLKFIDDYLAASSVMAESRADVANIVSNNFKESKNDYIAFQIDFIKQICDSINSRVRKNLLLEEYEKDMKNILRFYNESKITDDNDEYADGLVLKISNLPSQYDKSKNIIKETRLQMILPPIDTENALLDKIIERLNYTIAALNVLETSMDEEEQMKSEISKYRLPSR